MGSLRLADTIAMFSESLDKNIEELKVSQQSAIDELQLENERKFNVLGEDLQKTIKALRENLSKAEDEIVKLKVKLDDTMSGLKDQLKALEEENQITYQEKEKTYKDKTDTLQKLSDEQLEMIQQLEENFDQLANNSKIAINDLKDNLVKEIIENETAMIHLKEEQEKAIDDLKNYHDDNVDAIERRLEVLQENIEELRQELIDQAMALRTASQSIQDEFEEKIKVLSNILNSEKMSNQAKLTEVREILDGVQVTLNEKLEETQTVLMNRIKTEFKFNDDGSVKYGLDLEMAVVKEMLESLSNRVQVVLHCRKNPKKATNKIFKLLFPRSPHVL